MFHATSDAIQLPEGRDRIVGEPAEPMVAWRELPGILLRRWAWIVGGVIAGVVGALLAVLLLPATYTASTEILVQPTDLKAVETSVNQVANQPDAAVALLETAARVLASRKVLEPVVAKLDLAADPAFQRHSSGLREIIADARSLLRIDTDVATPSPAQIALEQLGKDIVVRRSERTFVITLSVKSKDPAKAARIASAIVASFFDVQAGARAEAARQVSEALTSRLAGLRDDVRRSEDAVQAFQVANNLAVANGQIVNEQQLSEASAQLLAAEKATADAKAKLDQLNSLTQGRDPGAIPEVLGSQTVTALRSALAQARRREAEAATIYGERYPMVAQIRSEVAAARGALDGEVQRIRDTARSEHERARASEANLRVNLARQQATSVTTNAARIHLRELQRDADASRSVYEDFLRRSRETAEQERVDTLNAWVISPPIVPGDRSFPPPNVLLFVAGLAVGLALGLVSALLRERSDPRLWTRMRVEAVTGIPVLAMIDAPRSAISRAGPAWDPAWDAGDGGGALDWRGSAKESFGMVQQLIGDDVAVADRLVLLLGSRWDDAWLAARWLAAATLGEVQRTTLVRFGPRQAGLSRSAMRDRLDDNLSFSLVELPEPSEPWEVSALIDRLRGFTSEGGLVIVACRHGAAALPQLARLADATLLVLAHAHSTRAEAQTLAQRLRGRAAALQGAVLIRWRD